MLHILKSALGDGLVSVPRSSAERQIEAADPIFGMALSEASENVRASVLQGVRQSDYVKVSVSHDSAPADHTPAME